MVVCEARYVERLAYTQTQAAALRIGRSIFNRPVLSFAETVEIGRFAFDFG